MNAQLKLDTLKMEGGAMDARGKSVLIMSPNEGSPEKLSGEIRDLGGASVRTRTGSLKSMNGAATAKLFDHDLVVIEADTDDAIEMDALRELLARPHPRTTFLALTRDDLSLSQARRLVHIGVDDVLPVSTPVSELSEAMRQRLAPAQPTAIVASAPAGGSVIAVAGARGGVGATSVAVNLAALLLSPKGLFSKKPSKKVVLVDLDLQFGSAGILLDLEDNGGMMQIVKSPTPPDGEFLKTVVMQHPSGLHVLTSPVEPVPLDALKPGHVAALLDTLKREYDYVVVDLPRALVMWLDPVLKRTDSLMLVSDTSVPAIRQCRRVIDIYTEENLKLPIEVVINGEKRPFMLSSHQKEAAKLLETRFRNWLPRDEKPMRIAADRGVPLVTLSSGSKLTEAYRRMARDLLKSLATNAKKTA
jgi:pilus assembly protein CpaE